MSGHSTRFLKIHDSFRTASPKTTHQKWPELQNTPKYERKNPVAGLILMCSHCQRSLVVSGHVWAGSTKPGPSKLMERRNGNGIFWFYLTKIMAFFLVGNPELNLHCHWHPGWGCRFDVSPAVSPNFCT